MPTRRFENLDPARRRQILEVAADHFAEYGFDGASFNRIIAASGLSKGAIYYYFEDKSDLFATVIRTGLDDFTSLIDDIGPVATADDFWGEVERFYGRVLEYYEKEPRALAVMRSLPRALAGRGDHPGLTAIWDLFEMWTRQVVRMGQAVGAVRDDLPEPLLVMVATALAGTFDSWTVRQVSDQGIAAVAAMVPAFVAMLRRMAEPD